MTENSIYIYRTGSLHKGSFVYYLILTHEFNKKILNATHIIKFRADEPIQFYVPAEIYPGSPMSMNCERINTVELKRMVIGDIFEKMK